MSSYHPLRLYNQALSKYPVLTQSCATAALFGAGDFIAQHVVESKPMEMHHWGRTLRLTGFGLFLAGPTLTHWYRVLDRVRVGSSRGGTLCAKVAVDQFLFSPCSTFVFFSANGIMEGKSRAEIEAKLNHSYWVALVNNWKVWIGVQFLNFYFVPLHHRLLVVNTVALGWNAYMSHLNDGA